MLMILCCNLEIYQFHPKFNKLLPKTYYINIYFALSANPESSWSCIPSTLDWLASEPCKPGTVHSLFFNYHHINWRFNLYLDSLPTCARKFEGGLKLEDMTIKCTKTNCSIRVSWILRMCVYRGYFFLWWSGNSLLYSLEFKLIHLENCETYGAKLEFSHL